MPLDLTNLYSGYQKAATYNRVDKKVLQKALKPYNLDFSSVKGKSDAELRKLAARTIINRYRKAKGLPPVISAPLTPGPRTGKSTDNF